MLFVIVMPDHTTPARSRRALRRASVAVSAALVLIAVLAWRWASERDPNLLVFARPVQGLGVEVASGVGASMPLERHGVPSDGVVVGRVSIRRPDGALEGVAATLKLHRNAGELPPAADAAGAQKVATAYDGAFVVETGGGVVTHCVVEHIDGVLAYARLDPADGFRSIVLSPAGRIRLLLPGNAGAFTLLMTAASESGIQEQRKGSMRVDGVGQCLEVCGVPLGWGSARLSVLFAGGGRVDLREPVPLVFRLWSEVTVDRLATSCSIRGVVVNLRGEAIARARVHAYVLRPSGGAEYLDTETDECGRFALDRLRAGRHKLHLSAAGYLGLAEELTLAGRETLDLGTRVLTTGATLRGRLIAADVTAYSVSLAESGLVSDDRIVSARKCDPNPVGEFSFENVGAGSWTVAVHARNPRIWATPWTGRRVSVRNEDVVVVVPELYEAQWSSRTIVLDAPEVTTMVGWKVVARGIDEAWCSYGTVDAQRAAKLEVGPGPFLLGVNIPRANAPGLVWCGVLDSTVRTCRIPAGQVVFDCSKVEAKSGYTLTVMYTSGPSWPPQCLPLSSEMTRIHLDSSRLVVPNLPPGTFEFRVGLAGETRVVAAVIAAESGVVSCSWPY